MKRPGNTFTKANNVLGPVALWVEAEVLVPVLVVEQEVPPNKSSTSVVQAIAGLLQEVVHEQNNDTMFTCFGGFLSPTGRLLLM